MAKKPSKQVSKKPSKTSKTSKPAGGFWIFKYFREAYAELKKVTWPSRKETWRLFMAVALFALILGTIIAIADYIFNDIMERILL